jgi:predicted GNAT family N-acyltransferase
VIQIVPHETSGYAAAVELRRRVLRWPLGLEFTDEELAGEADQVHFVDLTNGQAIACLTMVPQGTDVKMRQVAVDPTRQGQGKGRQIVEHTEAWAREQGFERITLHARETAVPFYLALGYEFGGEPFEEVGIPHRFMSKFIMNP